MLIYELVQQASHPYFQPPLTGLIRKLTLCIASPFSFVYHCSGYFFTLKCVLFSDDDLLTSGVQQVFVKNPMLCRLPWYSDVGTVYPRIADKGNDIRADKLILSDANLEGA